MATKTVLDLNAIDNELLTSDLLYVIRGVAAGRDLKVTGDRLVPTVITQSVAGNIDLDSYFGDIAIVSNPSSSIAITTSNTIPSGRSIFIINKSLVHDITFNSQAIVAGGAVVGISDGNGFYYISVSKSSVGLGNVDNVQQLPLSYLDTDSVLTANSDSKVASQKATKAYVDGKASVADLSGTAETLGGSAVAGVATTAARSDHKHAITNPALDSLAATTDVTTLNATTTAHGLLLKATAPASGTRNIVAIDNAETVYKNTALFDTTNPEMNGSAGPGSSLIAARRDHVHASDTTRVVSNVGIVAGTKTKITYDAKGLVTGGSDATTADIADSSNKRYVTDANLIVIGNTSNTNSGDESQSTIKTKLGAATAIADGYLTKEDWAAFNESASSVETLTDVLYQSGDPGDGDVLTYDDGLGKWTPKAPSGGAETFSVGFKISALLYVADSIDYIDIPFDGTLTKIITQVGTKPTGGSVTFDIREGLTKATASTILSADLAVTHDGDGSSTVTSFAVSSFSQKDRLWVDCNSTTGTTAADAQITMIFTKS